MDVEQEQRQGIRPAAPKAVTSECSASTSRAATGRTRLRQTMAVPTATTPARTRPAFAIRFCVVALASPGTYAVPIATL